MRKDHVEDHVAKYRIFLTHTSNMLKMSRQGVF